MTAQTVLLNWLENKANSSDPWFYSYSLEQEVPLYGRVKHNKYHTPSTYARVFRKLREEAALLDVMGIRLTEIKHNRAKKVKGWKIETT